MKSNHILDMLKEATKKTDHQEVSEAATTLKVRMNINWLKERLKEKAEYRGKWWVLWSEKDTGHSAGMKDFDSKEEAEAWDKENPPRSIPDGDFDTSEVFKS
jgi:hypothetical protein